jgi:hypothetical protein
VTRQPRATISLAKATKLIDDKTALQQPSSTKSGGRRKSAFAEEEEGYMFVEEGFRIRFANGEVIDFYADNAAKKDEWMEVLSQTVGKNLASSKGWTDMVLEKERKEKAQSQPAKPSAMAKPNPTYLEQQRPRSHEGTTNKSIPTSPAKPSHSRTKSYAPTSSPSMVPPPPVEKDLKHKNSTTRKEVGAGKTNRREQVRSMIF